MNISAIKNYSNPIQSNYNKNNKNCPVTFKAEINYGRFKKITTMLINSNHPDKLSLISSLLRELEGQEEYTWIKISDQLDRELADAINTIARKKQIHINTCAGDGYDPYKDQQLHNIMNSSFYGTEQAWDYKTGKKKPLC